MAIPSQPTTNISLGPTLAPTQRSIASEFSDPAPHSMSEFYRQGSRVPNNVANAGIPTSGAISMGQFNGATSQPAIISITYPLADTQNLNLLSYATSPSRPAPTRYTAGAPGYVIEFQVPAPVFIGSATSGQTSLTSGQSGPTGWHPDVTILVVNQGVIIGGGGNGGNTTPPVGPNGPDAFPPAQPGVSGGTALDVQRPITIQNAGTVSGGGGGGGGGGSIEEDIPNPPVGTPNDPTSGGFTTVYRSGGGGGGGAGQTAGSGGAGDPRGTGQIASQPGTPNAGGTGGSTPFPVASGAGGTGGARGTAGQAGQGSIGNPTAGGAGGAAGFYAVGNPLITWQATGTRQGQVS